MVEGKEVAMGLKVQVPMLMVGNNSNVVVMGGWMVLMLGFKLMLKKVACR